MKNAKRLSLGLLAAALIATASAYRNTTEYKVDSDHSSVTFKVPLMGGLVHVAGSFSKFNSVIHYDPNNISASSVTASIDPSSVYTAVGARDHELNAAPFFDVKKYPEIKFVSKRIESKGHGFLATGDLSLRGVTKSVEIPFQMTGKKADKDRGYTLGFEGTLHINRKDYGLIWQMPKMPNWLGDDVEIDFSVLAASK